MYLEGRGVDKNETEATKFYKKSCEMGFDYSCTKYKRLTHTFEPFEDQMDECKKKRTESEKSDCYYDVALRYARGEGVQEDTKKAARAFEASCEANNPMGCLFLGQMYYSGEGVLQDFRKSFEVFKRACRRANGFACERVGTQFYLGKGTTRDAFEALTYFDMACGGKNPDGCRKAGFVLLSGDGVRQDFKRAKEYFGRACDLKDEEGCSKYRMLNEKGY